MTTVALEREQAAADKVRPASPTARGSDRLVSVDALRGFDMFWIVGAGTIATALQGMRDNQVTRFLTTQLKHVDWEGFHAYDLIFPLFLFIVGVSTVFSLDKLIERHGRGAAIARVARRSALLFLLGVFYYGGLSEPWPYVQLGGVLPRIALCYFGAALFYCFARSSLALTLAAAFVLLLYWALMVFVPFPDLRLDKPTVRAIAAEIGSDSPRAIAAAVEGRVRGVFEEGRNLTNFIDFLFLPGRKAQTYYINEGLLSTIPALALPLLGAVAGRLLKNDSVPPARKVVWLIAAGLACVALAYAWGFSFPWIKRIWTSSFCLLTAGLSAILLGLFYGVIDVLNRRTWCLPFVWIGSNAIAVYLMVQIVDFKDLARRFVGGDVQAFFETRLAQGAGGLIVAIVSLSLVVLVMRFLYKRQIFLRV